MQIPWKAAPRAALSSPLTLLVSVVTALLLSFVVAAAVMHSSASGSAALDYEEGRLCEQTLHPALDARGGFTPELANDAIATARAAAGDLPVLAATYTQIGRTDFGGKPTFARFGYREGAFDHLKVLEGGSRDGLWVPQSIAKSTDLKLGRRGMGGTLPPVTAVYADINDPVEPWWCSERQFVIPLTLGKDDSVTSVVWMPSQEAFDQLPPALTGSLALTIRFPTAVPRTADDADALLTSGNTLLDKIAPAGSGLRHNVVLPLPVENARQTEVNVRSAILPLTLISLLIGLAGIGTVTVQWAQRRHIELRMLWCRGSGPLALGGRAVLELGLPLVLGGLAGLAVARLLLPVYAPSTLLEPNALPTAAVAVLIVVVLSLAVTLLVAALRVHRTFQAPVTSGRLRRVFSATPWELATAALAVLAWQRLQNSGLSTPLKIGGLPRIDAAALAFPLLVVLTTALFAARLLRWALRASHRASLWRTPAVQLAIRRLAAATGSVTGVLLVGVLAIGTIAVGSSVAGAQKTALDHKSGMYAGANSVVQIAADVATGRQELPEALRGNTTIVGISSSFEQRFALVVDPKTFTDGAFLGDADPDELRAAITEPLTIGTVPRRPITLPGLSQLNPAEYRTLPSFPKLGTEGYVLPRDRATDLANVGSWYLWSTKSLRDLTTPLQDNGITYRNAMERAKSISGLPFLTIQWTFGFVTAIGAVLAIVAAIALLLAIEVRRRQNAVSGALTTRMGMSPATLLSSHLAELGALAAFAVVVGSAASAISTGFAVPELDPAPRLTPSPALPNVFPLLLTTTIGSAIVVAVAAWIALRTAQAARIGELIRG